MSAADDDAETVILQSSGRVMTVHAPDSDPQLEHQGGPRPYYATADGQEFAVPATAAFLSETVQHLVRRRFLSPVWGRCESHARGLQRKPSSEPASLGCLQIRDTGSSAVVPIPTIHSRTLSKVLEYCKKHVAEPEVAPEANGNAGADAAADQSLEDWDQVRSCNLQACTRM